MAPLAPPGYAYVHYCQLYQSGRTFTRAFYSQLK